MGWQDAPEVSGWASAPLVEGAPQTQSGPAQVGKGWRDVALGGLAGAGAIGSTLIELGKSGPRGEPFGTLLGRIKARNTAAEGGAQELGADPQSLAFQTGKIGAQVAGTLGVGGGLARAAGPAMTKAPNLLKAIQTSGMTGGNALTRAAGGAAVGGVSAGLVDPESAGTGAAIGGLAPGAIQVAGKVGEGVGSAVGGVADRAAKRLMQSAIKPTIKQLATGEADTAVSTLLNYGITPNKAGVNKLRALIDAKNAEISSEIAGSGATIDKQNALSALGGVRQKFGAQVSPTSDLNAIDKVADDFIAHPNLPGGSLSVQDAQKLKQGTYRVLSGKYGQMGSAETEAQKALARGLKDEIATAVPAVGPLNAEESRLITTLKVAERRALMEMNKNPIGLAALANNPVGWAAFMADKSALFKSLAARLVHSAQQGSSSASGLLGSQPVQQVALQAAPAAAVSR